MNDMTAPDSRSATRAAYEPVGPAGPAPSRTRDESCFRVTVQRGAITLTPIIQAADARTAEARAAQILDGRSTGSEFLHLSAIHPGSQPSFANVRLRDAGGRFLPTEFDDELSEDDAGVAQEDPT